MKTLNPYFGFDGECRDAMTFYQECLGGELSFLTVGESPMAGQMPAEMANQIMHSTLTTSAGVLMGSDMRPADAPKAAQAVVVECTSEEEINRLFAKFSEGGKVACAVSPAFWGGLFGSATDKFGVSWLLNFPSKE